MSDKKKERTLTISEQKLIDKRKARFALNRNLFHIENVDGENKKIAPNYIKNLSKKNAESEFDARLTASTGCSDDQVALTLLSRACEALSRSDANECSIATELNKLVKAISSLQPKDEIEGHLIAQMIVLQEQSMHWLGRAMRTQKVEFANTYLNCASKLMTRHHEAITTLMKYRRGGEQRVYVEHVHVNDGGKAIVGNIGTGGGVNQKIEEGPHAKV